MKKSEITVTMPIYEYEKLVSKSNELQGLKKDLVDCYDCVAFSMNESNSIRFDYEKAEKLVRKYLPFSCEKASVIF